jgi:hypothetical protein
MSDQGVRLDAVLTWLERNRISTADAVKQVRTMKFPVPPAKGAYARLHDDANGDHHPPEHGAFFHIADAFSQGKISRTQYEELAEAATQAMKEHSG